VEPIARSRGSVGTAVRLGRSVGLFVPWDATDASHVVEFGDALLRRDGSVAVFEDGGELVPVDLVLAGGVQVHTDQVENVPFADRAA
jgi:hypothetical protein